MMVGKAAVIAVAVFLVCPPYPEARAQAPSSAPAVTIEQVRRAWQGRQDRVRSARVAWSEERFMAALPEKLRQAKLGGRLQPRFPDRDLTFKATGAMSLSGNMLRYVHAGKYWHPFVGELLDRTYTATFDGDKGQTHSTHDPPRPNDLPAVGFIKSERRHPERANDSLIPTLMTFRPYDANLGGVDVAQYAVSARAGAVEGVSCVLLEAKKWIDGMRMDFWLDPHREFVVLRAEKRITGQPYPHFVIDVSYQKDASLGWIPSAWKYVNQGGGPAVREQTMARVTRYEINVSIPRSEFQIVYPPGTIVRDLRTREDYAVKENSEKRAITKEEIGRGAPYTEYFTTESGKAGLKGGANRSHLPWALLGMAAVAATALAWWTRRRALARALRRDRFGSSRER